MSFAVSELCVAFVTYYNIVMGMHLPTIVYAGLFPLWSVFYITGIYLGRLSDRQYNPIWSFLLVLVGLVFSQLETKYLYDLYGAGLGIKPSSFLYSEAVVLFLFSGSIEGLAKKVFSEKNRMMIFLGSISFGIYLVHYHFKNLVQHITDSWALRWVLVVLMTIITILLLRRFLPQKKCKYFGI